MRVLLTLAVCKACLIISATSQPASERKTEKSRKASHGTGAPESLMPAFLDRSEHLHSSEYVHLHSSEHRLSEAGVEAAVHDQRLDSDADLRTKELMSQLGKMEGELEEAREENSDLNRRFAKQEISFAQKEENFASQLVEFHRTKKMDDLWLWRLEMGFVAQLVVALVLGLSCCLCRCQICKECAPCGDLAKNSNNDARHKWAAQHRPMDPELKEKLRIRRLNLDAPGSPGNQQGLTAAQKKECEYFSLAEEIDAEQESPPLQQVPTAFPAVFTEPRPSPGQILESQPVSTAQPEQSDWWASSPR